MQAIARSIPYDSPGRVANARSHKREQVAELAHCKKPLALVSETLPEFQILGAESALRPRVFCVKSWTTSRTPEERCLRRDLAQTFLFLRHAATAEVLLKPERIRCANEPR
jgi:hypothetical protein